MTVWYLLPHTYCTRMCDIVALAEPEGPVTVPVITCNHTLLCDVTALAEPEGCVTCYHTLLCEVATLAEPEG